MILRDNRDKSVQNSIAEACMANRKNGDAPNGFIDIAIALIFAAPILVILLVVLYFSERHAINKTINSVSIARHRSKCASCLKIREMILSPLVTIPYSDGKIDTYEADSINYYNEGLLVLGETNDLITQAKVIECLGLDEFVESISKNRLSIQARLEEVTQAYEHRNSCPNFQQAISLVKEADKIQKASTGYFITKGRRVAFCEQGLNKLKEMETLLEVSKCDYCESQVGIKHYLDINTGVKSKLAVRINE